jgi:molecular chaperone GrpE
MWTKYENIVGGWEQKMTPRKEYIVAQPETLADYQAALEDAQQRAADYENRYLRAAAALENTRKQAERTGQERSTRRLRDFSLQLLDVVDNLERALAYATDDNPLSEGVQATLRQFYDVLAREDVRPIQVAPGEAFDPHWHEATEMRAAPVVEPTVLAVQQRGYTFGGQVLRPARVVVAHPAGGGAGSGDTPASEGRDIYGYRYNI